MILNSEIFTSCITNYLYNLICYFRWNFFGGGRQAFEARRVLCLDISLEHTQIAAWERESEKMVSHKRFYWKYLLGVVVSTRGNRCLEEDKQQKVLQLEVRSNCTGLVNGFCLQQKFFLLYFLDKTKTFWRFAIGILPVLDIWKLYLTYKSVRKVYSTSAHTFAYTSNMPLFSIFKSGLDQTKDFSWGVLSLYVHVWKRVCCIKITNQDTTVIIFFKGKNLNFVLWMGFNF